MNAQNKKAVLSAPTLGTVKTLDHIQDTTVEEKCKEVNSEICITRERFPNLFALVDRISHSPNADQIIRLMCTICQNIRLNNNRELQGEYKQCP